MILSLKEVIGALNSDIKEPKAQFYERSRMYQRYFRAGNNLWGALPQKQQKGITEPTSIAVEDMDIRKLRTFVHVVQLGSISLAADRLHIAQSALTRHIQSLEAELKVKLLTRHGRGVRPTAEGELLAERAGVVMAELESIRLALQTNPKVLKGEVSFGVPPSVGEVLTVPLIEKFTSLHPQTKVRSVTGASGHVLDWLQRGMIDLGIIYEVNLLQTVKTEPLTVEHLYLVEQASPNTDAEPEVSLRDALSRKLVLASHHHGLRQLLEKIATTNGLAIDTVAEADSVQVQLDLVRRGLGVTILPFHSVASDVRSGKLFARLIVSPKVTRTILLAHAIDRPLSTTAHHFAEMIVDIAPTLFPDTTSRE